MSMFAFVSILFTYYGVNFHLVGLHSYAKAVKHLELDLYSLEHNIYRCYYVSKI
jgi:hypothetical protein